MGRKPKSAAAKAEGNNAKASSNPPFENMKDEQTIPSILPSKMKSSKKASPSSLLSKNKSKEAASNMNMVIRQSGRLRSLRSPMSNQDKIVEEIDLADSEKEEAPLVQQLNSEPLVQHLNSEPLVQHLNSEPLGQELDSEPLGQELDSEPLGQELNSEPLGQELDSELISNQQKLEDKIDFLVHSVKQFASQGKKRPFPSEIQSMELNYRSLYIESQKKIEALTEENHQLAKKLEFANGKVEAFEKMKEVLGDLKDMVLISNLGRTTEAVMNLSSQAATGRFNLPEATTHAAAAPPVAVDEQRTTSPATRKKYGRKKK